MIGEPGEDTEVQKKQHTHESGDKEGERISAVQDSSRLLGSISLNYLKHLNDSNRLKFGFEF